MSVRYLNIGIYIHGLNIEDEAAMKLLVRFIREQIKAELLGRNKEIFGFRDEFDSDIEVEVLEYAGNLSAST